VLPASNTPYLVAATGSAVYVAGAGAVMRVDPQTGKVVDRVALGGRLRALLAAQGRLWVTADGGRLVQLDPDTLGVVATRHVTGHPDAITTDGGSVLVTDDRDRTLTRMTIANGKATGTTTIGANGAGRPSQITVYAGSIWVYEGTTVLRVATGALQLLDRVTVPGGGGSIAAGTGGVWVSGGFGVARIDPATGALDTPVAVGQAGAAIATTGDAVWLVQRPTGTLLRLVPS
jgi:glutamine cyclotransferase